MERRKLFDKMTNLGLLAAALLSLAIFGCAKASDSDDDDNGGSADIPALYKDFANYPTGRQSASGLLTLTNEVNSAVLVFIDSVSAQNYIGTIPALSSITVSLPTGKFYSIVAVTKNAYEENQTLAAQSSVLAYYSNLQAYSVSVSPEDLTGSATWIFNNNTNYWVSVEKTDNSGDTYAVIAPNAKRVSISVQKNQSYDYKVVYKKQLKYRNNIIAVSNITSMEDNDTASFINLTTFTTDLNGTDTDVNSNLAPTVQFINNTGKTLRVYNGQVQLADTGIKADDYTLVAGVTAFFSGFTAGTQASAINVRSVAWSGMQRCTDTTAFENGKVYKITIAGQTENNLSWTVTSESADSFYTSE